jgi:hypothetical protein
MKKQILALVLMLTVAFTSAFATKNETFTAKDDGISQYTAASFKKDFATATNVSWQVQPVYTKVTFTFNDQIMFAYYSKESNELLAVVRNIPSTQLPIKLFTSLKNQYNGYWITSLFEIAKGDETSYYITLEKSDETLVLEAKGINEWVVYKKIKKD